MSKPVESDRRRPRGRHVFAAAAFLVGWLSFVAFIALYRAPLPSDAFTALSFELIARADAAMTR